MLGLVFDSTVLMTGLHDIKKRENVFSILNDSIIKSEFMIWAFPKQ